MRSSLLALVRSLLVVLLWVGGAFAAPPKVTISGQVFDANGLASAGTTVTFRTVGVQTLPDTDKTVVPPTTFTSKVGTNGTLTPVQIPKQLVIEIQVGRAAPRTVYTGTDNEATLGSLLAAYNPEIPVGNGGSSGGTTIVSGGDAWVSFSSETQIAAGQTVYVSPGGATTATLSEAVFPAGTASWSSLSCVSAGGSVIAAATLYAGDCGTIASSASTQTVSNVSSSVVVSSGGAASTTAAQCVALKIETSGTGNAYVNCAVKRTAL